MHCSTIARRPLESYPIFRSDFLVCLAGPSPPTSWIIRGYNRPRLLPIISRTTANWIDFNSQLSRHAFHEAILICSSTASCYPLSRIVRVSVAVSWNTIDANYTWIWKAYRSKFVYNSFRQGNSGFELYGTVDFVMPTYNCRCALDLPLFIFWEWRIMKKWITYRMSNSCESLTKQTWWT